MRGLRHGRRRVDHLEDAGGGAAHALEGLGRGRQARHELERDERDQRDPGEPHAVEGSCAQRGDADEQGSPHRKPGAEARQPLADSRGARARAGDARDLGVRCPRTPQLRRDGAVDDQLGGALHEVHDRRGQLPPRRGVPRLGARGERPRQPRHAHSGEQQRDEQDRAGGGEHQPDDAHGGGPDDHGDRERGHHAQQQVLQGVHVVDEAREQLPAAERGQAERGEALQPFVDAHPQVGQHTEGRVVADEPLAVAAQAAREREELHADDRHRDGGLLRALRGAGDQPRGGGDQADRSTHGAGAEQRGERQPPHSGTGESERASQRGLGAAVVLQRAG